MPAQAPISSAMRVVTVPVLLIITGALFLVDYGGGYGFAQTWPVLLIWLGIGKALEFRSAP